MGFYENNKRVLIARLLSFLNAIEIVVQFYENNAGGGGGVGFGGYEESEVLSWAQQGSLTQLLQLIQSFYRVGFP